MIKIVNPMLFVYDELARDDSAVLVYEMGKLSSNLCCLVAEFIFIKTVLWKIHYLFPKVYKNVLFYFLRHVKKLWKFQ